MFMSMKRLYTLRIQTRPKPKRPTILLVKPNAMQDPVRNEYAMQIIIISHGPFLTLYATCRGVGATGKVVVHVNGTRPAPKSAVAVIV